MTDRAHRTAALRRSPRAASPHPVVIVGAGAAGIIAALFARRGGSRVVLLERTEDGGRKILISGGGRCNILPSRDAPERFVTDSSPNTLRRILRSWPLAEQRAFLERELGMRLVLEEESGKLFPETQRARDVRDRLLARVREAGGDVRFKARMTGATPPRAPSDPWRVEIHGAPPIEASCVVLAAGGLSVPATGSDGSGIAVARALGHEVHATYPALTPLLAAPPVHAHLAGVSLEVTLRAPGARPRFAACGGFLFTHRGYSGPVVLDASHLAVRSKANRRVDAGENGEGGSSTAAGTAVPIGAGSLRPQLITVQWTPLDREAWERVLVSGRSTVESVVAREIPSRLAEQLVREAGVPAAQSIARLERETRRRLVTLLTEYPLPWTGDEGYKKAEVTGGGVSLAEIDPRTMESRRHPRLFLCGEMLDAFGPIGGYNFEWAWSTGRAAGVAAATLSTTGVDR